MKATDPNLTPLIAEAQLAKETYLYTGAFVESAGERLNASEPNSLKGLAASALKFGPQQEALILQLHHDSLDLFHSHGSTRPSVATVYVELSH